MDGRTTANVGHDIRQKRHLAFSLIMTISQHQEKTYQDVNVWNRVSAQACSVECDPVGVTDCVNGINDAGEQTILRFTQTRYTIRQLTEKLVRIHARLTLF